MDYTASYLHGIILFGAVKPLEIRLHRHIKEREPSSFQIVKTEHNVLRTKDLTIVYIQEAFVELFVQRAFGVLTWLSFCRDKNTHCFWTSYLLCVTILQWIPLNVLS